MKKRILCPKCKKEHRVAPDDPRTGPGYSVRCTCGHIIIVTFRLPYYFHDSLLAYAREHLIDDETRGAVVEAHAAIDYFVRRWSKAALGAIKTPDSLVAYLMERNRSTEQLVEMVKDLFPSLGLAKMPGEMIRFRNEVIHDGREPTKSEALHAIDAAKEWIDSTMKKASPAFTLTPDISKGE